jgi:hypothetical protein
MINNYHTTDVKKRHIKDLEAYLKYIKFIEKKRDDLNEKNERKTSE